jgi:hypothetical protein
MTSLTFRRAVRLAILACTLAPARAAWAGEPPASAGTAKHPSPPITADLSDPPLLGDKDGVLYLRDSEDRLRLYPRAELALQGHGFLGDNTSTLGESDALTDLGPRFFVRRARFELGGELFKRVAFDVSLDLVANPALDGAQADSSHTRVALVDAWGSVDAGRGLSLRLGVFQAPFSLENTTRSNDLALMERNIATRFMVPGQKVLGAAVSSVSNRNLLRVDVGVFGAESLDPGRFERSFDGMAHVSFYPVRFRPMRDFQVGFSLRFGARNLRESTGDLGAITSGQGFAFFRPTRTTADGRTLHIMPSTGQQAGSLELRLPLSAFVLRSEIALLHRGTRESFGGVESAFSERRGELFGVAWYAEASVWLLQLLGVIEGEMPVFGEYPRNQHLEVATLSVPPNRYGPEIAFMVAGVNASYDSASRGGVEPTPPLADDINVLQLTLGINYWHTRRFKLSLNLSDYIAKGSGRKNLASVPGSLGPESQRTDAISLYEIGARTTLSF